MNINFAFNPKIGQTQEQLGSFFFDPEAARSQLIAAEDAGFNSVVIDDPAGLLGNLDLASYAGSKSCRLDVLVTHWADVMSPEAAARQLAIIDLQLGGRLSLRMADNEQIGRKPSAAGNPDHITSLKRTDEYLMLLARLWLNDTPFDYEGPYHSIRGGYVAERRVGGPRIAIRMGGQSGTALQVAARHADVFELSPAPLFDIRTMMRRVNTAAAPFGRAGKITFALPVAVVRTKGQKDMRDHPACGISLDDPSQAALTLLPFIEAGVSEFMISGLEDVVAIRRFGHSIMPIVRNSAMRAPCSVEMAMPLPDETMLWSPWSERSAKIRWRGPRDF